MGEQVVEKTIEIQLKELREQIAQEIEGGKYAWLGADPDPVKIRKTISRAAEIARGGK